ncbi:MAG: hypothetical protein LBT26_09555 [Clostridiales Family XIII bacterium]|jgi:hypothetical protein|nr:hypothetical protein [Clostridiales Family XIII bacterium]
MSEEYYLGGYYLLQLTPCTFGTYKDTILYSCSNCLNDNLMEGWITAKPELLEKMKAKYGIDDSGADSIQKWIGEKFDTRQIITPDAFPERALAVEFQSGFFSHLNNVALLSIHFDRLEANELLNEFNPKETRIVTGINEILGKNIPENHDERFLGFDLIGIENGGQFHSFHCHDIGKELENRFGLQLNRCGLFENSNRWAEVTACLNDQEIGCEPVPWFVTKVKMVKTGTNKEAETPQKSREQRSIW